MVDDPLGADTVRQTFADFLVDAAGELAYVVERPKEPGGLYRLLDRSGVTLARSRAPDAVVQSLCGHLASLALSDSGGVLLKMRALEDRWGKLTLLTPPFGIAPPLVERRLGQIGLTLVPAACLGLMPDSLAQIGIVVAGTAGTTTSIEGSVRSTRKRIARVVVPAGAGLGASAAGLALSLANASVGNAEHLFPLLTNIALSVDVVEVSVGNGTLYRALV